MPTDEYVIALAADGTPKYVDRPDVDGWAGVTHDFSGGAYDGLPFQGQEMWIVRVWGPQSAHDGLAAEADAYGKREYGLSDQQIATALNEWSDRELSYTEWWDRFVVG